MCNNINNNNLLYQNTCISLSIMIACRMKTYNEIPKGKSAENAINYSVMKLLPTLLPSKG